MAEEKKPSVSHDEIAELKRQMDRMQELLAKLSESVDERSDGASSGDDGRNERGHAGAGAHDDAASEDAAKQDGPCDEEEPAVAQDDAAHAAAEEGDPAEPAQPAADAAKSEPIAVEPVAAPEGPDASAASSAPAGDAAAQGRASAAYAAYAPPAAGATAPYAASTSAGSPTPPPAYAATAQAQQQARTARAEYTQPTGQQAYQQNGYGASPQMPYNAYGQGYYQQPIVRTKDHVAAGLLGIFLGMFGIHKFYLGYNTAGFIMLGVAILGGMLSFGLATGVIWLIGLIEGIIYLVKNQSEFEQIYVFAKREWF